MMKNSTEIPTYTLYSIYTNGRLFYKVLGKHRTSKAGELYLCHPRLDDYFVYTSTYIIHRRIVPVMF